MTFVGSFEYNVFVPTFAPQYRSMVERGGKPGVSLEDATRAGVWVPMRWFDSGERAKPTWKQYSADELEFLYSKKTDNSQPVNSGTED